ncbi:MAG: UTRA domain-containing protein [Porticoccaceae bacterium]|nr:UTRA domain-containing protein [Porticoccaceae bacterium]
MPVEVIKLPQFALIKQYIQGHIDSGTWPAGTRTPSENDLCSIFSVSRMTARRALQELADQGILLRTPGLGTFVAEVEPQVPNLEIPNIVEQAIKAGSYSRRILSLGSMSAPVEIAELMHSPADREVYRALVVHLDKQQPIQWQALYVNPELVPAFLKQNYTKITPEAYLDWVAPASATDLQLEAVLPSPAQRRELGLTAESSAVCMQLNHRCWNQQVVRNYSQLVHPASRFHLGLDLRYSGDSA